MNILTFSTLYPNNVMHRHGIFVENRLRKLVETGKISARVIAPVPWFPFTSHYFGEYAQYARVNKKDTRYGITIEHPRYMLIPKIGMNFTPYLMSNGVIKTVEKIISEGFNFDLIDAHYFYPDGVAAAIIAKRLGKPFVITARGTDVNLIPRFKKPKEMILNVARQASGIIAVCQALKDELVNIGVDEAKIQVLRNGVDKEQFSPPLDREKLRQKLGITGRTILSVGHLIERKGHDLIITAIKHLPDIKLLIAGDGELRKALNDLVAKEELGSRVSFLGEVAHDKLKDYYGASDALVLASSREGWANVLLESMACGTPVVATNIWGTPEVVKNKDAGVLVDRTADSITEGIKKLFSTYPDRNKTRLYAEQFDWDSTTKGQLELFDEIVSRS